MVELFGRIEKTDVQDGKQVTIFRIPAVSQSLAEQRAGINARLKGLSNFQLSGVRKVGSGSFPGQSIFDVKVESDR